MELEKKTLIRIGAGVLILIVALAAFMIKNKLSATDDIAVTEDNPAALEQSADEITREMEGEDGKETEPVQIIVDVGGAVKRPGIAGLKEGSRVYEAIAQAGGLREDADTNYVNMADFVADGEKIYIPKIGELEQTSGQLQSASGSIPAGARIPGLTTHEAGSSGASASDGKINLNTATSQQLQTLTGIGPSTAQKILDYRTQNGNFKSIEAIKNVSGIGDKTYEKFKDKISI